MERTVGKKGSGMKKLLWLAVIAASLLTITKVNAAGRIDQFEAMILLKVNKSTLKAELRTLERPGYHSQLLHSFRIAIGKGVGDKEREGDNRTPEGIYFSLRHIEASNLLASKYGRSAIPLNFPNHFDRLEGKTGYGIWLHGAGNDKRMEESNVTEGCIAFYNADILKLEQWLLPSSGAVVIAKNFSEVNRQDDMEQVFSLTNEWLEAWKNRAIDQYISFYDQGFKNGHRDIKAYKTYKRRVFSSYKKMEVKADLIRVLTHPKYAVSFMNQDFHGDRRFHSLGRKVLYWQKTANGWKIIKEFFDRKKFSLLSFSDKDLQHLKDNPQTASANSLPIQSSL
ncbi:MAG: L,D-transpeptidase family protein [Oligoflexales bacterium]|nr:L,D-transpeptidase family protein [Oligoflexales bacterium]